MGDAACTTHAETNFGFTGNPTRNPKKKQNTQGLYVWAPYDPNDQNKNYEIMGYHLTCYVDSDQQPEDWDGNCHITLRYDVQVSINITTNNRIWQENMDSGKPESEWKGGVPLTLSQCGKLDLKKKGGNFAQGEQIKEYTENDVHADIDKICDEKPPCNANPERIVECKRGGKQSFALFTACGGEAVRIPDYLNKEAQAYRDQGTALQASKKNVISKFYRVGSNNIFTEIEQTISSQSFNTWANNMQTAHSNGKNGKKTWNELTDNGLPESEVKQLMANGMELYEKAQIEKANTQSKQK